MLEEYSYKGICNVSDSQRIVWKYGDAFYWIRQTAVKLLQVCWSWELQLLKARKSWLVKDGINILSEPDKQAFIVHWVMHLEIEKEETMAFWVMKIASLMEFHHC